MSIAFMFQRMVAGRIDGYALSGSSFLWKAAFSFGIWVEGAGVFPRTDDLAIHFPDRCHITADDLITDLRRFLTPLDSFSGFLASIPVVLYGPGFIKTMSVKEAVLTVTEVFLCANRIPAQISAWAIFERPPSDWSGVGNRANRMFFRGLF